MTLRANLQKDDLYQNVLSLLLRKKVIADSDFIFQFKIEHTQPMPDEGAIAKSEPLSYVLRQNAK